MPKKENDAKRLARLCDEAAETDEGKIFSITIQPGETPDDIFMRIMNGVTSEEMPREKGNSFDSGDSWDTHGDHICPK